MNSRSNKVSIIIPAKNESRGLSIVLPQLRENYPDFEIIVVDDGSDDDTNHIASEYGAKVISHKYSMGNGAAIKTGSRLASGDFLVFMDGDGQHDVSDIKDLLAKLEQDFDMVVGARSPSSQASFGRLFANTIYNWFASIMVGQKVQDLTSGFRAVKADKFREFLYLLPNGFSYPTTSTMAFFRSGYSLAYIPIVVKKRVGKSHIRIIRDGLRFLLILFKIGSLYSPLKIFAPFSLLTFITGLSYYLYTYYTIGRLTNMSAILFTTSVVIFLMGLISEQITMLLYQRTSQK